MAEKQLLVFKLGREEYGVTIQQVREIIRHVSFAKVPDTPYYMEGIINLREKVIPIINLAKRFEMTESTADTDKQILIIELQQQNIGIVVDQVTEVTVMQLDDSLIKEPPSMVSNGREFIEGLCQYKDRLIIVLDLSKLIGQAELGVLQTASYNDQLMLRA